MPHDQTADLMSSAVFSGEVLADSDTPCPKCITEGTISNGPRKANYLKGEQSGRLFCPVHGSA